MLKYKAVTIIGPEEANRIRRTTSRILPSRYVITRNPDPQHPGKMKTEARWCIRGYLDPDLLKAGKQTPTVSAQALALAIQVAASTGWKFTIADIEGAFLQGGKLQREDGDIYVELP